MRLHGRGRQVSRALLAAALAFSLGACATAEKEAGFPDEKPRAESLDTGSCRPWFKDSIFSERRPPNHSCWNLAWEIPVALVAVPAALGFLTAPVWVPIVLLK